MKMNRIFAALCAIVALGVSCQKEMTVKNDAEEIIVPEGMKYVSFEVGASTKITGNPAKWASGKEDIAVLAIFNGESKSYKFETAGTGSIVATTTISGLVDEGAELKFVLFPYNENDCIDLTADPSGNTFSLHKFSSFSYSQANSVAMTTPFACKIEYKDGVYSAASDLKPLYSFLKVVLPTRATDKASNGTTAQPTSYVNKLIIEGTGVAGATTIDFSGEEPNVALSGAAASSTINVTTKIEKNSNLPAVGYCLVPIVPGTFSDLKITAQYVATSSGVQYEDYIAEYSNSNTCTRGAFKSVEVSGPFVTSATTSSATIDGSTLSMTGSAVFYTGGKVTASNYNFGFQYSVKGSDGWTSVPAVFADNKFTASVTVDPSKTYEVKAFVTAPGAIKPATDQTVYGEPKESGAYVPPVTYVIDTFGFAEYDGTNEAYCWKCTDNTFPKKDDGKAKTPFTFDYYKNGKDTTPYFSGIILYSNSTANNISFNKDRVLLYSGYVKFPGITGKKVTNVTFSIISSSTAGNMTVASLDGSTSYGTATYVSRTDMDLSVDLDGNANDGVKVSVQTWNIGGMKITYSAL